jgi:hypothetical protein
MRAACVCAASRMLHLGLRHTRKAPPPTPPPSRSRALPDGASSPARRHIASPAVEVACGCGRAPAGGAACCELHPAARSCTFLHQDTCVRFWARRPIRRDTRARTAVVLHLQRTGPQPRREGREGRAAAGGGPTRRARRRATHQHLGGPSCSRRACSARAEQGGGPERVTVQRQRAAAASILLLPAARGSRRNTPCLLRQRRLIVAGAGVTRRGMRSRTPVPPPARSGDAEPLPR